MRYITYYKRKGVGVLSYPRLRLEYQNPLVWQHTGGFYFLF